MMPVICRFALVTLVVFSSLPVARALDDDDVPAKPVSLSKSPGKATKAVTVDRDDEHPLDDFLGGTEVYQTEEKGGFELEADMFLGRNLQAYSGEIEYGVTDNFMLSLGTGYRRELESEDAGDPDEAGSGPASTWTGEFELRYRLPHQRAWPVDVAFSLEVAPQFVRSQATQWTTEPRLILQRTFGSLTATANIGGELGRYSSLELSGGLLYQVCSGAALGGEVLYDSRDNEVAGIPQIFLFPTRHLTVVLGYTFCSTPSLNTWDASLRFDF